MAHTATHDVLTKGVLKPERAKVMIDRAYRLVLPRNRLSCAVFSSPHSGRSLPPSFMARVVLDELRLRSSEDAYVDQLIAAVPAFGAPLLVATYSRAYVDLNRAADDLDPAVVHGAPKRAINARICAGLGVIPRVVGEGRAIMSGKITLYEAESRLARGYRPYHNCLSRLLTESRDRFGEAILLDCHSMPSAAQRNAPRLGGGPPEIVLGDRYGASCAPWVFEAAHAAFVAAGFRVACNTPFAGGHITQFYGRPAQNLHALQIEIDRAIYMDETTLAPRAGFEAFARRLTKVLEVLSRLRSPGQALAAE